MRIEFGDLKLDKKVKRHFKDILKTNIISGGPKVEEFEKKWGKLFDYKYNVAMSSGTSADIASCMTLYDFGAKRNDEILVPALAFASTGNSVLAAGFKPVFVDIERNTLNVNPNLLEEKITKKTKAIMVVHTMGKPCNMDIIGEITKKYDLKMIEDCCEAYGATYKGKFVGNFGDVASFSYYVAHLICCGDGGMASTNNPEIFDLLKSVKSHGRNPDSIYFDHPRLGLNFRMNELVASVGLSQLDNFWKIFKKRKDNLYYLLDGTKDLEEFAYFNSEGTNEIVNPHAFSVTLKDPHYDAKGLYKFLEDNSVKCKRNFGSMPTQHKAFEFLGHRLGEFPEAEYVGENGLHFGVHQYISKDDLNYVLELLHNYFGKFK